MKNKIKEYEKLREVYKKIAKSTMVCQDNTSHNMLTYHIRPKELYYIIRYRQEGLVGGTVICRNCFLVRRNQGSIVGAVGNLFYIGKGNNQ